MSKKSILAETLEEVKNVKSAIEKNASKVLRSTLKEELEDILKKGISSDEDGEDEDIDTDPENTGMDSEEDPIGSDSEEMTDDSEFETTPGDELPGDEVIDLTDKSDEEVLKTFELIEPTDQIEIVRTGDGIKINFNPEHKESSEIGDDSETGEEEINLEPTNGGESEDGENSSEEEEEEMMYEIEIDDTDDSEEEETVTELDETDEEKEEVDEVKSTTKIKAIEKTNQPENDKKELHEKLVSTRKKLQAVIVENKKLKEDAESFKSLKESFKKNEGEYKEAITLLKGKLQEVAVYTTNLTHAVKLMTENSTTKDEKFKIISTLDTAKTISESKQIATTLEEQFKSKKTASAAKIIEEKVLDKQGLSGTSQTLNETHVYKNPQIDRMKEIMNKIK